MSKMRFEIIGDCDLAYNQKYTYVDLTDISRDWNFWNAIDEILRERFHEYNVEINHVGKTIRIDVDNTTECEDCGREFELTDSYGADVLLCESCGYQRESKFLEEDEE